jgi:hypothetical protein
MVDESRQAGADEIEITEAMIAAGAAVIAEKCETGPYWASAVAKDVYAAMIRASQNSTA